MLMKEHWSNLVQNYILENLNLIIHTVCMEKIPTEIEKIAVENDGLSDHLIVGTLLGRTSSSVVFISFIIDDDEVDELLKKTEN